MKYFNNPKINFKSSDLKGSAPKISWLINGFLPSNIVGMIAAAGGSHKSYFLLQLAYSIITKNNFFNMQVDATGSVLFCLGEEDQDDVHRRLDCIRNDNKNLEEKKHIEFLSLNGVNSTLHKESELFKEICDYVVSEKPKLIILDPIARFFYGEENSSKDSTKFVELLEHLKNLGTTVLFSHHTNKIGSNNLSQDSSRGSTALVDAARWQIILSKLNHNKKYKYDYNKEVNIKDFEKFIIGKMTKSNGFKPSKSDYTFKINKNGILIDNKTNIY